MIQTRTAGLYTLAGKVRELATARDAVATAQATERTLLAEALEQQQALINSGWAVEELRKAGLYVGAAVVRRRRNSPAPDAETAPTGAASDVVDLSSGESADNGAALGDGQGAPVAPVDAPVPVG
jgi:hypothetical protein